MPQLLRRTRAHFKPRRIEYKGTKKDDGIVIGNYGDVYFRASGVFELSGIMLCLRNKVTLIINGRGKIAFTGSCKHLVIRSSGSCVIDLRGLNCAMVECEHISSGSIVWFGKVKRFANLNIEDGAMLKIFCEVPILSISFNNNSKVEIDTFALKPVTIL